MCACLGGISGGDRGVGCGTLHRYLLYRVGVDRVIDHAGESTFCSRDHPGSMLTGDLVQHMKLYRIDY